MKDKFLAWIAMIQAGGSAPPSLRILLALLGMLVLLMPVAIYLRTSWFAPLNNELMIWTSMFMALGLAMIWTAGRGGKGGGK